LIAIGFKCNEIKREADPPGFEPGSEAPEASILSRLYYESILESPAAKKPHDLTKLKKIMEYIGLAGLSSQGSSPDLIK
jgi:hypothetical protein